MRKITICPLRGKRILWPKSIRRFLRSQQNGLHPKVHHVKKVKGSLQRKKTQKRKQGRPRVELDLQQLKPLKILPETAPKMLVEALTKI